MVPTIQAEELLYSGSKLVGSNGPSPIWKRLKIRLRILDASQRDITSGFLGMSGWRFVNPEGRSGKTSDKRPATAYTLVLSGAVNAN